MERTVDTCEAPSAESGTKVRGSLNTSARLSYESLHPSAVFSWLRQSINNRQCLMREQTCGGQTRPSPAVPTQTVQASKAQEQGTIRQSSAEDSRRTG